MSSRLNLLVWENNTIDKDAKNFINERNDVVNASSNVTILGRSGLDQLSALTFSSPHDVNHTLRFISRDTLLINHICNHYKNVFTLSSKDDSQATGE
jgi:hypothetical protein